MRTRATLPTPWRPVGELRAALALLTRLPVATRAPATSGGAAAFGLVGALVGAAGGAVLLLVGDAAPLAAAALALGLMGLVTGGLHLDGLADTSDALAASGSEAAERARTDPRIGAAGAAALAIILILDMGWLVALTERHGVAASALACTAAAAVSRALVVAIVAVVPGGRRGGSGGWFSEQTGSWSALAAGGSAALVVVLAALLAADMALVVGAAAGALIAIVAALWLIRARDGIDGDLLGAIVDIAFTCVLGATVLVAS